MEDVIGRVRAICLAAAVFGALCLAAPVEARERLLVTEVVGPPKSVRSGEFGVASARCPRGFHAIGSGLLLGAIEPVSDFRANRRVWKSDGYNPEENFTAFSHRVQVTCISGRRGLAIRSVRSGRGASTAAVGATTGSGAGRDLMLQARSDYAKGHVGY